MQLSASLNATSINFTDAVLLDKFADDMQDGNSSVVHGKQCGQKVDDVWFIFTDHPTAQQEESCICKHCKSTEQMHLNQKKCLQQLASIAAQRKMTMMINATVQKKWILMKNKQLSLHEHTVETSL